MRLFHLTLLAASATGVVAEEQEKGKEKPTETVFGGITVPQMLELTPNNWKTELEKSRFLVVKNFSPYCHHCRSFAPTYQTLYEFYDTLAPGPDGKESGSMADYHGLRFGQLNCIAYRDFCQELNVTAWPQTSVFKKGQLVDAVTGNMPMVNISDAIEKALQQDKPGSRPASLTLPEPGSKEATMPLRKSVSIVKPPKPLPPQKKFNLDGVSVSLTADSFQKHVTMTQDPWFIKFYAPWCHHCQAMEPTWNQLAKSMRDRLNIGEVNCEIERRLCSDVSAGSFPTILFFKGGEKVEYLGLRGPGDFLKYAENALDLASGVPDVDAAEFEKLEKKEDVIFVYFYDHAATSEDFAAIERLPLNLIGHAKLVKTKDQELYKRFKITTWPRLIVSREGRPTYYTPFTPSEMRNVDRILSWIKSVWLPLVPELTATNARQIMENKLVVLGILHRKEGDPDSVQSSLREMKSAANEWMDRQIQEFQLMRQKLRDAKQMRIEEAEDRDDERALRSAKTIRINMDQSDRKEVAFAWVDGIFWERWLRTTYGVVSDEGERIIINDESTRRYWDQTVTGNHILVSRTSIMETLDKIVNGPQVIKPKFTVSLVEKIFFDIRVTIRDHSVLSVFAILGLAYGILSWFRGRRGRRGHFFLDDGRDFKDGGGGLLGGGVGANTKAD